MGLGPYSPGPAEGMNMEYLYKATFLKYLECQQSSFHNIQGILIFCSREADSLTAERPPQIAKPEYVSCIPHAKPNH